MVSQAFSYVYSLSYVSEHAQCLARLCLPAIGLLSLARSSTHLILTHAKTFSKRGDPAVAPAQL
jgi:hypothetical protein